jgi:hypothetical protein
MSEPYNLVQRNLNAIPGNKRDFCHQLRGCGGNPRFFWNTLLLTRRYSRLGGARRQIDERWGCHITDRAWAWPTRVTTSGEKKFQGRRGRRKKNVSDTLTQLDAVLTSRCLARSAQRL